MNSTQNAATALQKTAPSVFRIIPAGAFSANDGRENGSWFLSEHNARLMVVMAMQRKDDYVIDYEHQTLHKRSNDQLAPAAGWFKQLEWRTDGLYVLDARWTEKAKAMIESDEYRFISPVFNFSAENGMVTNLHSVALTNTPALHGLTDLSLAAATAKIVPTQYTMTERERENYRWVFGGTPEELEAALAKSEQQPHMPGLEGMTEKDQATFRHVFGHLFKP